MEWYHYVFLELGITLLISIIIVVILSFREKLQVSSPDDNAQILPEISRAEKIKLLKYTGLEHTTGYPDRVFYDKTETKRILFFSRQKGVLVLQEYIDFFSKEELLFASCYGTWVETENSFSHFYDCEETALKEWAQELRFYHEESLDFSQIK